MTQSAEAVSQAQTTPLPNIDAMAKGLDSLTFDMYDPAAANKSAVFAYQNDKHTLDGKYVYPSQFNLAELNATSFDAESYRIYNAYDFQQQTAEQFSVGGGFWDFTFSASASFKNFQEISGSSDNVATESHAIVQLWRLTLTSGASLPLAANFKTAVAALPTDYASGKGSYMTFIDTYGTHYISDAIFGGRTYQLYIMNSQQAAQLTSQGVDVSAEASIALAVNVGTQSSSSQQSYQDFINTVSQESVQWVGGVGAKDFDTWAASVINGPEIVQANLIPIYDLLSSANFPNVGNIDQLRTNMQQAYGDYLQENGQSAGVYQAMSCAWVPQQSLSMPALNFLLTQPNGTMGPSIGGAMGSPLMYWNGSTGGGRLDAIVPSSPGVSSPISIGEDIYVGATGYTEAAPWYICVMQAAEINDPSQGNGFLQGYSLDQGSDPATATWRLVDPMSLQQSGKALAGTGYLYQLKNPQSGKYVKIGQGSVGAGTGLYLTEDATDPATYWTLTAIPWPTD